MGNHAAGQAVGLAAEHALSARQAGEPALAILDRVCDKYRACDAEFESEDPEYERYTDPHPKAALGMLMVEAFAPNGLDDLPRYAAMRDDDAVCDRWWDEVYEPFRERFGFC